MNTKYDWSGVDPEVKWIAMDEDGVINGFVLKPIIVHEHKMWFEDIDGMGDFISVQARVNQCFNWQDSLEERPNEFN